MKTQIKNNTNMKNAKLMQMTKKQKREAEARRKVNQNWQRVERQPNYRCAATWLACTKATDEIKDECFDGILLQLNERNEAKSTSVQRRLLRRIVEKRQAQSVHRAIGRSFDRFSNRMKTGSISECVDRLHRHRFCA